MVTLISKMIKMTKEKMIMIKRGISGKGALSAIQNHNDNDNHNDHEDNDDHDDHDDHDDYDDHDDHDDHDEPECNFWTHNPHIGRCWLKKSDLGRTASTKGSNSGQKSCGVTGGLNTIVE